MTNEEKPLSPEMKSALEAVERLRADAAPDAALWAEFGEDLQRVRLIATDPRQGSKPAGR